jgi:hypothetical protein
MSDWTDSASRMLINDLLTYDKFLDLLIKNSDDDQETSDIDDKILRNTDKKLTGTDEPDDAEDTENSEDSDETEDNNDDIESNDSNDSEKNPTEFKSVFDEDAKKSESNKKEER